MRAAKQLFSKFNLRRPPLPAINEDPTTEVRRRRSISPTAQSGHESIRSTSSSTQDNISVDSIPYYETPAIQERGTLNQFQVNRNLPKPEIEGGLHQFINSGTMLKSSLFQNEPSSFNDTLTIIQRSNGEGLNKLYNNSDESLATSHFKIPTVSKRHKGNQLINYLINSIIAILQILTII